MTERRDTRSGRPTLRQILSRGHLRLVLIAVGLAAVSLLIVGIVVARDYSQRNLALVAATLNYAVEPAVVFNDREAIHEAIGSVVGHGNIRRVEVLDTSGEMLVDWIDTAAPEAGFVHAAADAVFLPEPRVEPVLYDGRQVATLRIYASSQMVVRYALNSLLIVLCSLAITLLATRILAKQLEAVVLEPLAQIAKVARAVRHKRSLGERVETSGIAEIDSFAKDFNALLEELEGWQDSLLTENRKLAYQASHDPLTGLGNREHFEQVFHMILRSALRTKFSFALLYIDLDQFKSINDHFGHSAGDAVLVEMATRLAGSIRKSDYAFRLGGDEFAVLLDFGQPHGDVEAVVSKVEAALARPIEVSGGVSILIGQSLGWAVFPDHGAAMEDLVRRADIQMYERKRSQAGA